MASPSRKWAGAIFLLASLLRGAGAVDDDDVTLVELGEGTHVRQFENPLACVPPKCVPNATNSTRFPLPKKTAILDGVPGKDQGKGESKGAPQYSPGTHPGPGLVKEEPRPNKASKRPSEATGGYQDDALPHSGPAQRSKSEAPLQAPPTPPAEAPPEKKDPKTGKPVTSADKDSRHIPLPPKAAMNIPAQTVHTTAPGCKPGDTPNTAHGCEHKRENPPPQGKAQGSADTNGELPVLGENHEHSWAGIQSQRSAMGLETLDHDDLVMRRAASRHNALRQVALKAAASHVYLLQQRRVSPKAEVGEAAPQGPATEDAVKTQRKKQLSQHRRKMLSLRENKAKKTVSANKAKVAEFDKEVSNKKFEVKTKKRKATAVKKLTMPQMQLQAGTGSGSGSGLRAPLASKEQAWNEKRLELPNKKKAQKEELVNKVSTKRKQLVDSVKVEKEIAEIGIKDNKTPDGYRPVSPKKKARQIFGQTKKQKFLRGLEKVAEVRQKKLDKSRAEAAKGEELHQKKLAHQKAMLLNANMTAQSYFTNEKKHKVEDGKVKMNPTTGTPKTSRKDSTALEYVPNIGMLPKPASRRLRKNSKQHTGTPARDEGIEDEGIEDEHAENVEDEDMAMVSRISLYA